jgi:hypothetical protein
MSSFSEQREYVAKEKKCFIAVGTDQSDPNFDPVNKWNVFIHHSLGDFIFQT